MRLAPFILILSVLVSSGQIPRRLMLDELRAASSRAVPWSPTSITGLIRWYDAQSIVGLNNGDAVAVWADKQGTTNLTQADATACPIYYAADPVFGNKPAVYFDGSNDSLTNVSVGDASVTYIVVMHRTNAVGSVERPVSIAGNSSQVRGATPGGPWYYYRNAASGYVTNSAGAITNSGPVILRYNSLNSADMRAYSGAWVNFDPNDQFDDAGVLFCLGAEASTAGWSKVFIGELLIYDSPLSDSDVNLVGRYLAARWNFTWTDL